MALTRRALLALLIVPGAAYLAVTLQWETRHWSPLSGDEPHYLIVADAIARDHTADVRRAYARDARTSRIIGPTDPENHTRTGPAGTFSVHDVGLPLIVAPVLEHFGVTGVRVELSLIAAVVPLLLCAIAIGLGLPAGEAIVLAVVVSLGLPFLSASGQIYPDLPSGVALLALVTLAVVGRTTPLRRWHIVVGGLILAILPWFHIKNSVAALAIVATIGWCSDQRAPAGVVRKPWLYLAGCLLTSLAGRLVFNTIAFGHLAGPLTSGDAAGATVRQAGMIFLGLHFDQLEGVFIQQPLLLLGLPGLAVLWLRSRRVFAGLAATYLAVMVPNAFHPCWYGCWSMGGRFMWSVAAFWFVPAASLYKELGHSGRSAILALSLPALAYQAMLWHRWSGWATHHLFSALDPNPYERNSLFSTDWTPVLPSYMDFSRYVSPWPNIVAVACAGALLFAGIVFAARIRSRESKPTSPTA